MFNIVLLHGRVSRLPEEKAMPSGSRLVTFEMTIPKPEGTGAVPISWFDPPGWVTALREDNEIVVRGQIRRRFFRTAGGPLQSRTDVVAAAGALARRASQVGTVLAPVLEALAEM